MDFWNGKNILITGGAGFLGSAIVEQLARRGVSPSQLSIPAAATSTSGGGRTAGRPWKARTSSSTSRRSGGDRVQPEVPCRPLL